MKDKKIDYTVIGFLRFSKLRKISGVRSFFNVVKTDENNEYLQGVVHESIRYKRKKQWC
ncbi:hypothetical protein NWP96_07450 [Mycoplasmopsis cynos]|nr:hypothetical protein [Mycoplasmopsis cynos]